MIRPAQDQEEGRHSEEHPTQFHDSGARREVVESVPRHATGNRKRLRKAFL